MMPPFLRLVHRIRAADCPNVRDALVRLKRGLPVDPYPIISGAITYEQYLGDRATLPPARQQVQLDADWWEGADEKLVLGAWCDAARAFAVEQLDHGRGRAGLPRYMGVDTAAGGDDTAWVAGDRLGVDRCKAKKTPNTNDVYGMTLDLMRAWNVPAGNVVFDLGGGGREHVHRLRANGHAVRGVAFGKMPTLDVKRAGVLNPFEERRDVTEDAAAYSDRRSEMAWDVRLILERGPATQDNPHGEYVGREFHPGTLQRAPGFGLAGEDVEELVRQLTAAPVLWDGKGRFKLIPKESPNRRAGDEADDQHQLHTPTFRQLIGRSPDLFDALCCMVFGMTHRPTPAVAGGW